ncbi:MAG: TraX family protein [Pseudobdellovibrionaceae bacterium]
MFARLSEKLPATVTSYDVWKTLAILLMVVDHIGACFYPDHLWWRVAGRLCVPIWFFLIGYARSRDLDPRIIGGVVILTIVQVLAGQGLFPLTILAGFLLIRGTIDSFMRQAARSDKDALMAAFVLLMLFIPTNILFEYGTSGYALAVLGWLDRARQDGMVKGWVVFVATIGALAFFILSQALGFEFDMMQSILMGAGVTGVTALLMLGFKSYTSSAQSLINKAIFRVPLQLCGRWSLEIYVLHLAAFKIVAAILGIGIFHWLDIKAF